MSKKTEAEPAPPEASESPPEQPVSPAAAGDGKGEAKGEAPAKKGTAKRKSPGTSGGKDPTPKSFATTLAARTERSLADMYRIQDGIPEEVIEWSVSAAPAPAAGAVSCARALNASPSRLPPPSRQPRRHTELSLTPPPPCSPACLCPRSPALFFSLSLPPSPLPSSSPGLPLPSPLISAAQVLRAF